MSTETLKILRRPVITEKSTLMRESNRYVVEVDPAASKFQIRKAIEDKFKVKVVNVHTVRVLGKYRRKVGPVGGYQPDWKKAIVKVKAGQKIAWEEVV